MNDAITFLFFLFIFYCHDSVVAYITYLIDGSKMPYRKVFIWQIPAIFIQSAMVAVWGAIPVPARIWATIPDSPNIIIESLLIIFLRISELAIPLSWVFFLFRKRDIKKRFFYAFTVFQFYTIANYSGYALIEWAMPENPGLIATRIVWTPKVFFVYYGLFALTSAGISLIARLLSNTSFWGKLQAFGNYPKLYMPMGTFCLLIYSAFAQFSYSLISQARVLIILNLFSIAFLTVIVLIVSDIKRTENLTAAQNLLLQQQNYISKLESIQQEIRGIQHDYKNMLAGLYAHASEGDAGAVREYIDTKLLRVDETVREDLKQMNQLTLIEIPELKGLVLTKMLEAERDRVTFRIEVMFPVRRASMSTEDLLRCVGILLDNAIEEARTQKNAAVTLLLLQEDSALTVVVKNPVRDKPDLTQIWNRGYSTKDPGRGVGLFNYQRILEKYTNVTNETKIEGEHFVQILVM